MINWVSENYGTGNFKGFQFEIQRYVDENKEISQYQIGHDNVVFERIRNKCYVLINIQNSCGLEEKCSTDCWTGPNSGKGTWLLELTLELINHLDIKQLNIYDVSTLKISNNCEIKLAVLNTFLGKKSWYEKHGASLIHESINSVREKLNSYPFQLIKQYVNTDKNYQTLGDYMRSIIDTSLEEYNEVLNILREKDNEIDNYVGMLSGIMLVYPNSSENGFQEDFFVI